MRGEQVRKIRSRLLLSQAELAAELSEHLSRERAIAKSTIARWELGTTKVPEDAIKALQTLGRRRPRWVMLSADHLAIASASREGGIASIARDLGVPYDTLFQCRRRGHSTRVDRRKAEAAGLVLAETDRVPSGAGGHPCDSGDSGDA